MRKHEKARKSTKSKICVFLMVMAPQSGRSAENEVTKKQRKRTRERTKRGAEGNFFFDLRVPRPRARRAHTHTVPKGMMRRGQKAEKGYAFPRSFGICVIARENVTEPSQILERGGEGRRGVCAIGGSLYTGIAIKRLATATRSLCARTPPPVRPAPSSATQR